MEEKELRNNVGGKHEMSEFYESPHIISFGKAQRVKQLWHAERSVHRRMTNIGGDRLRKIWMKC